MTNSNIDEEKAEDGIAYAPLDYSATSAAVPSSKSMQKSSLELDNQDPTNRNNNNSSSKSKHLKDPHIELFLTMQYRKMQRDLNGPQKKKTKYHLIVLLCFLIIVYGFGSTYEPTDDGKNGDGNSQTVTLTLTLGQIVLIGVWVFVAIFVTAIFGKSKFILLLYWLLVYWPLLAVLATTLVNDILGSDTVWIGYMLIVVEIMTVVVFVCVNYAYPRLVTSNWFRQRYARWFWNIKLLDDGLTMQYDGIWGRFSRRRYECRYVGELNDKGLPHGRGVWADDSCK